VQRSPQRRCFNKEINMSSIKSLSAIAILIGAYLVTPVAMASAQAETFANGRSWYGVPNNPEVATRVVDVNSTDAINIECGETVTFRNGDKSFTWRFDVVNHRAVDIQKVAPVNFSSKKLMVYVSPNDFERN
jgi:hypothetical protein